MTNQDSAKEGNDAGGEAPCLLSQLCPECGAVDERDGFSHLKWCSRCDDHAERQPSGKTRRAD